jgi:hypothetical protein
LPALPAKTATAEPKSGRADSTREDGGAAPSERRRRHVPVWAVAVMGLALGAGFGMIVEGMKFGPPLVMLALGGMTLALCGVALWRVIDPLTRPEVALALDPRGRGRARELEREKQAVLKAIKEIELDHQMRKIADGDYRELVERYRGRAMRLIGEIEAGDNYRALIERELKDRLAVEAATGVSADGGEAAVYAAATDAGEIAPAPATSEAPVGAATPASAANACHACGVLNDSDAQFCKKCGVKLGS